MEIILNHKRELLRIFCEDCGHCRDIIVDMNDETKEVRLILVDSSEPDPEVPAECQLEPICIIK